MQTAAAHLRGILAHPTVVNREDIVGYPKHFGCVFIEQPLHFIDHQKRFAPAVRLSIDLVAAPSAFVRASPGSDEVDGTLAMRVSPCAHISADVNRIAGWPWRDAH